MAIEHQKSIILLIANKLYGSAFSLIRIQFEAYIRGVWFKYCADEREIEKYKNNKLDKKIGELIEDIEKNAEGYEGGTLSKAKADGLKAMNSFTHTGFSQVVRRNTETTIEPNYDIGEIKEAINFTNFIGLLACLEISFLAKNKKLSMDILEKTMEIEKITFNNGDVHDKKCKEENGDFP